MTQSVNECISIRLTIGCDVTTVPACGRSVFTDDYTCTSYYQDRRTPGLIMVQTIEIGIVHYFYDTIIIIVGLPFWQRCHIAAMPVARNVVVIIWTPTSRMWPSGAVIAVTKPPVIHLGSIIIKYLGTLYPLLYCYRWYYGCKGSCARASD